MPPTPTDSPSARPRLVALDVIRGVALCGILIANVIPISATVASDAPATTALRTGGSSAVDWLHLLVLQGAGLLIAGVYVCLLLVLRHFRYGPLEWAWRWATWLRRPPLRLPDPARERRTPSTLVGARPGHRNGGRSARPASSSAPVRYGARPGCWWPPRSVRCRPGRPSRSRAADWSWWSGPGSPPSRRGSAAGSWSPAGRRRSSGSAGTNGSPWPVSCTTSSPTTSPASSSRRRPRRSWPAGRRQGAAGGTTAGTTAGTDPALDPRSGYGLVGMRERVEALGGALSAGPRPDGGWTVLATLPLAVEEPR